MKKPTLIFQKDKNAAPVLFCRGCAGIQLQRFVGNQLAHRDALLIEAIGVAGSFIGIADNQNVDRLQVGREVKFLAQNIGLEVAYPHRSKAQLCGLEHHVVGQDGGVNVTGLLLIERPYPRLIVIGANNNSQGRTVDIGRFTDLRKTFLALNGNQANRLKVGSGRAT